MSSEIWTKEDLMSRVQDEIEDSYSPKSSIDSSVDEQVEQITDRIWIEKERQLSEIPNEYHDEWLQIVIKWLDEHHQEFNLEKLEE
jgi:hypothetical protein